MNQLTLRIGSGIGCFDYGTGHEMNVMRSVEITEECPTKALVDEKVILDFSQGTAGRVVRVVDCALGEDDGLHLIKYIDQLEDLDGVEMLPFRVLAEKFGLTPARLVLIIKATAPEEDRKKLVADLLKYAIEPDNAFDSCLKRAGLTTADLNHEQV